MAKTKKKPKVTILYLNNYEEFNEFISNLNENTKDVYFMFIGKKQEDGRSWCIYCQMADPVVASYLNEITKYITFVYVDVGDKPYWKDSACPFRTDPRTKLTGIPTIIKWQGVQRLVGEQCTKVPLLQMLFENEEEY